MPVPPALFYTVYFACFTLMAVVALRYAGSQRFNRWLEEKTELLGERVGAKFTAITWQLLRRVGPPGGQEPGSFYVDMTTGRHEALSPFDGNLATDQRVLFLHEVEMGTNMNFKAVSGHTVHVSSKHARRIHDFITFNIAYSGNTEAVFAEHGYALQVG